MGQINKYLFWRSTFTQHNILVDPKVSNLRDLDAADGSSSGSSDPGVSDIILPSTSSFMVEDDDSSQVI